MTVDSQAAKDLLEWPVQSVLDRWPESALALIRFRLGCIGCQLAQFHTLKDVAAIYGLPANDLLRHVVLAAEQESGSIDQTRSKEGES
jgi:hybrid cluster-associated redox disulfide protein